MIPLHERSSVALPRRRIGIRPPTDALYVVRTPVPTRNIEAENGIGVLNSWREHQWAKIRVETEPVAYERAASAFLDFIHQVPDDLKESMCLALGEDGENATRTELGYRRRKPETDSDGEDKIYFHYSPEIEKTFAKEIALGGAPARAFMDHARGIWNAAYKAAKKVTREIDESYPGFHDACFPSGEEPIMKIRFLVYKKVPKGNLLGVGHYDRGTVTLALAESAPGLRIGRDNETLKVVTREPGEAVIMAGTVMRDFEPDPAKLPLSWHDIQQDPHACLNKTDARWAIIALLNSKDATDAPRLCCTHHPE